MRRKSRDQIEELLDQQRGLLQESLEGLLAGVGASEQPADVSTEVPSARAFDALRESIEGALKATWVHQAHLALIHRALLQAGGPKAPLLLVNDLLRSSGVRVERDLAHRDLFTDPDGGPTDGAERYEVRVPAYVDAVTGRVIQQGVLARLSEVPA